MTFTVPVGRLDFAGVLKGDTGTGIAEITFNEDYTLTITLTDGTSYTTGCIRGRDGASVTGLSVVGGKINTTYVVED